MRLFITALACFISVSLFGQPACGEITWKANGVTYTGDAETSVTMDGTSIVITGLSLTTASIGFILTEPAGVGFVNGLVMQLNMNAYDYNGQVAVYDAAVCVGEAYSTATASPQGITMEINEVVLGDDGFISGWFSGQMLSIDGESVPISQGSFEISFNNEIWNDCENVTGCSDPTSLNYNPTATIDNGTCYYCVPFESFVYFDYDYDLEYNSNIDQGLAKQIVNRDHSTSGTSYITTNADGKFAFIYDTGPQILSYYPPPLWEINNGISQYDLNLALDSEIENLNFGVVPITNKVDLSLDLTTTNYVCSMETMIFLNVKNEGTETVTGVHLEIWVNQSSTIQSVSSNGIIDGNYINWIINGDFEPFLLTGQDSIYSVEILLPGIDELEVGSILIDSARVSTLQPDILEFASSNNFSSNSHEFLCAYDPNDKQVLPRDCYNVPLDTLEYTIRFQNTGNYPATTVMLLDTLNLEKLDIMSLEILGGSHDYEWSIKSPSVLEVVFNNINLVDSSVSFLESQGFIKYGIRVREELPNNSPTATPAYIFFDNNPPIVTNEPEVRFYSNLSAIINQNNNDLIANVNGGTPPYNFLWNTDETSSTITPETNQEYWVIITDNNGCVSNTDYDVNWIESNVFENESDWLSIYPNPASNSLTIDLGDLTGVNTSIKLYDSSSKLVFDKQSSSTLMIDVSVFAKGLYTLELSTSDKVLRSQVVLE